MDSHSPELLMADPLFQQLLGFLGERLSDLDRNAIYTAKKLCGDECWKLLSQQSEVSPNLLGKMISFMADRKLLPIEKMDRNSENALLYRVVSS